MFGLIFPSFLFSSSLQKPYQEKYRETPEQAVEYECK